MNFFNNFSSADFPKAGWIANQNKIITPEDDIFSDFPITMIELFRKLGLVVEVKKSKLTLIDFNYFYFIYKSALSNININYY